MSSGPAPRSSKPLPLQSSRLTGRGAAAAASPGLARENSAATSTLAARLLPLASAGSLRRFRFLEPAAGSALSAHSADSKTRSTLSFSGLSAPRPKLSQRRWHSAAAGSPEAAASPSASGSSGARVRDHSAESFTDLPLWMNSSTSLSSAAMSPWRCVWNTSKLRARALAASALSLFFDIPRFPPLPVTSELPPCFNPCLSSPLRRRWPRSAALVAASRSPQIAADLAIAANITALPGLGPIFLRHRFASARASAWRRAWHSSDTTIS
mmetsp:Transcript_74386/g.210109  ORF Transcript_74386/g.210109 Transcript_74386/m.210109 type:complete len:268 (-) Transcript_74386:1289-2092(-)